MKITVIGTGYVGLIAGLGFADFGNSVECLDIIPEKVEKLNRGICPIYEPGAEALLERNLRSGRIHFTTDTKAAVEHGEVIFIAVGTPPGKNGEADLTYVFQAARDIAAYIKEYTVVVDKSTVPVGTAKAVREAIEKRQRELGKDVPFDVASNPEFLREGKAIGDFLNPDRIVLGVSGERPQELLLQIYQVFKRSNKPVIITNTETAEMIKYASNAFLATKITFINEMANLCEKVGANVQEVAAVMGKDGRISPKFLHAGPGYGGSCFPKDTQAIAMTGRKYGAPLTLVESVIRANEQQKLVSAQKIERRFPEGATVAILGLAFKPETDDVRESPAIAIIQYLARSGNYKFRVYDPQAMDCAHGELAGIPGIKWCSGAYEACRQADCVAIVTEWLEFRNLDRQILKESLNHPVIFDFRNIYEKSPLEEDGFEIFQIGVK